MSQPIFVSARRSLFFVLLLIFLGACGECGSARFLSQGPDATRTGGGDSGDSDRDGDGAGDARGDGYQESDGADHEGGGYCGDGECRGTEDSANCRVDCPQSPNCGDGVCSPGDGDNCRTCPEDCGVCEVRCGDGVCWGTESCATCSKDCGNCVDTCGDGVCEAHENQQNCPYDCGFPPVSCGDNTCNGDENCETCPGDCGSCSATCAPGQCLPGENCRNCPSGCGVCTGCGDGACYAPESCESCEPDCGVCLGEQDGCGDGVCEGQENPQNCPVDCGQPGPACGDGLCNGTEDALSCPLDCEAAPAETCPDGQCYLETCQDCPQDCGTCQPRCGDGLCQEEEQPCACVADCGECSAGSSCGDGSCDLGETQDTCATDCPSSPGCPIDSGLPECQPSLACTGGDDPNAGDVCDGIREAWKSTADNVGYYPYKVQEPFETANIVAGVGEGIGDPKMLLATLNQGDIFAVQSTRNPGCMDNPPLREYTTGTGFVFGYAPSKNIYGWIEPSQLAFAGYEMSDEICTDGVTTQKNRNFQVRQNPYDNCRAMPCDTTENDPTGGIIPHYNDCASANSIDQSRENCGGKRVSGEPIRVAGVITPLFYSQQGTAHRFLYPEDKVKLLYKAADPAWGFVEVTQTSGAPLTKKGDRGWALLNRTCPEDQPDCVICEDKDMDGYGENCEAGPDCNDNDPAINPGAREVCDNQDNDCNGRVDDGAGCATQCIQDSHEPDNSSLTGNKLTRPGIYKKMTACAKCPKYDPDWFWLGSPSGSVKITLEHPTGNNSEGRPHGLLNAELYCGANFCDSLRGSEGTKTKTFDGTCAPEATISRCAPSDSWTLMVYTRCSQSAPVRGTPYTLRRH